MNTTVLRDRGERRVAHVTNMELFFDLVFVFAITQLSTRLYGDLSWLSAAETGVLFLALWWAWNLTAWATGWIDPERAPVMLVLALAMLLSLVMAASIPDAFAAGGHHGAAETVRADAFAVAYVLLQLGRSGFMVWAFARAGDAVMETNFTQLLAWSALSAIPWLVGALLIHAAVARLLVWTLAALIDFTAPLLGFWLPRRGATPMSAWSLAGGHLAERCQLLVMIAFGETILRLGEAFADGREHAAVDLAFGFGFFAAAGLWAVYFRGGADGVAERIAGADADAARIGRSGYAYAHMFMVAGVILLAVALHIGVEAPLHHAGRSFALVLAGGPVLYLGGIAWSAWAAEHGRPLRLLLAAGLVAAVAFGLGPLDRLAELGGLLGVSAVLVLAGGRTEGGEVEPSPHRS